MCARQHKLAEVASNRTERRLRGLEHPISVLELTKNEAGESSILSAVLKSKLACPELGTPCWNACLFR